MRRDRGEGVAMKEAEKRKSLVFLKEDSRTVKLVCTMMAISLFLLSALMLLSVGVRVYRNIAVNNLDNFELRISLSFVATRIHQNDGIGRVYLSAKDGTTVLMLEEEEEGYVYETILYHKEGVLYELYQEKGTEYGLDDGMEVMNIASFSFFEPEPGVFRLTAANAQGETESMYVTLRSAGE